MSTTTLAAPISLKSFKDNKKPLIIAGPCSAEERSQVLETGRRLFKTGKVDLFRAGIWKPRTRPGTFEGVGAKGLPWMQEVKDLTGLPLTVEVAKGSHVDLCLEFGIDVLWIGARTSVNPFAIQEIADALKGVKIPIMIKNPINPDLALWLGGIERIMGAGIEDIAAIHRGFSNFSEKLYRNKPQWQIAIDFKSRMPDVPLICDPSHICGRRDLLADVSQKAFDLGYHGLMVESHIDPDNAWSDAAQQITPEVLSDMLANLVVREGLENDGPIQSDLERFRSQIDQLDEELLHLLSNRMKIARQIGEYKKEHNMTILQQKRWKEVVEIGKSHADTYGLSEEFVAKHLRSIHDESINQQEQIMKGK